ncbi:WxL domain-containing protein [Lactococcus garvieae]|uniref:WxL domain-containing protein n=1 Tax=Lactococcus garvieae TaxID=1363 RepID=UPI003853E400
MKLRYLLMSAAVLTSTAGAALGPIVANADGATYTDETHVTTKGSINFTKDDTPVDPVDPDDPDNPIDPVDPDNPSGAELMINYASNLNFGTQSKSDLSWNAYADKINDPENKGATKDIVPFVSVKDSQGSDRTGWNLTVKQDGDFKNGETVLKGAVLKFSGLHYAAGDLMPTATAGDIALSSEAQTIASADAEHGAGNTSLALGSLQEETEKSVDENGEATETKVQKTVGVNLSVPSGTVINTGTYSTSVTYELTAGV